MEAISQKIKQLNTFGVQFIIRQDKLKEDKAPLYCRITVNGEIVEILMNVTTTFRRKLTTHSGGN